MREKDSQTIDKENERERERKKKAFRTMPI
jgi:hypothetical protein